VGSQLNTLIFWATNGFQLLALALNRKEANKGEQW
jgi:hypothetical protein